MDKRNKIKISKSEEKMTVILSLLNCQCEKEPKIAMIAVIAVIAL